MQNQLISEMNFDYYLSNKYFLTIFSYIFIEASPTVAQPLPLIKTTSYDVVISLFLFMTYVLVNDTANIVATSAQSDILSGKFCQFSNSL